MSNNDGEEPMECDSSANSDAQQPLTNPDEVAAEHNGDTMSAAQPTEEAQVLVCLKWSTDEPPQKCKRELQRALQTRLNKNSMNTDCSVLKVSLDGRQAAITIKPASALSEFLQQTGQDLTTKDGTRVTIVSVQQQSKPVTDMPDYNSVDVPTPLPPPAQDEEAQLEKPESTANASAEDGQFVYLPVGHLWYVNQVYKKEMSRIERENGAKFKAEVKVSFEVDQKDGSPSNALSEFTDLVQKCLGDSSGLTFPLKDSHPEDWKDTLKIIQRKESKLMLTVSSEEITVCGPRESQEAMRRSLNITQITNINKSALGSEDASLMVTMTIKDPLVDAGLTMEESLWKMMTTSLFEKIASIKTKFGVDFKESRVSQGGINVKACSTNGESISMLSHALRALLCLYQKVITSPRNFWAGSDQAGREENLGARNYERHGFEAEGKHGTMGNQQMNDPQVAMEGGTTVGNSIREKKEEDCPICLDTLTNKKQLKCHHEFCSKCLERATNTSGPICPVCKAVFGKMEGDQPDGCMKWVSSVNSLPGFPNCGSIVITYDIFGGKQTEKHPQPGSNYGGITRTAHLPDSKEGNEVLGLLRRAFNQKLIFTIGTSRTTGLDNQVTWNDIHHKTSSYGGPQCFGYPDPGYLSRVRDELKAKGIE